MMATSDVVERLRALLPELEYARETHRQWRDCDQTHRDRNPDIGDAEFHGRVFDQYNERIEAITQAITELAVERDGRVEMVHELGRALGEDYARPRSPAQVWDEFLDMVRMRADHSEDVRYLTHDLVRESLGLRDVSPVEVQNAVEALKERAERAEAGCADKDNALLTAARQVRWYEEMHRSKPDHEKADRNAEMASLCERSLSTDAGRAYADRMERYRFLLGDAVTAISRLIACAEQQTPPHPNEARIAREQRDALHEALQEQD